MIDATLEFSKKTDDFGRLFSHVPWLASVAPKQTEYQDCRDSAMRMYEYVKVRNL